MSSNLITDAFVACGHQLVFFFLTNDTDKTSLITTMTTMVFHAFSVLQIQFEANEYYLNLWQMVFKVNTVTTTGVYGMLSTTGCHIVSHC